MEFINGYSVVDYLNRTNGVHFTEPVVLQIFRQTATILSSFHRQHIYHRDIKPENIMLAKDDDNVYFVDFGFSTESENEKEPYVGHTYTSAPEARPPEPYQEGEPFDIEPYQLGPADIF
jgi:serine/threonine protein kinase